MPYVAIHSAMPISEEKMDFLQKEIGRLITIIPTKTIDNCMTKIEENCHFYMSGRPAKAVFCEIRLRGTAPKESKVKLIEELGNLFERELGAEKVYTNFLEFKEWGVNTNYLE